MKKKVRKYLISYILLLFSLNTSLAYSACGTEAACEGKREKETIALLVHRGTANKLKNALRQYRNDVESNFNVRLLILPGSWTSADEMRSTLKNLYRTRKISGGVLVGALPMHKFHMHDFNNPDALYYEDFDLKFEDLDGDGISDRYSGVPHLKIWVANLRATEKENDEGLDLLSIFFQKTHDYYSGRTHVPDKALAATGSDWPDGASEFAVNYGNKLFGNENLTVLGPDQTTKERLMDEFNNNAFRMFYIQVHSGEASQRTEKGIIHSSEIAGLEKGALFIINHGCSTCNWLKAAAKSERNTGMSWVFGKSIGQAVICNVRVGMVFGQDSIYSAINKGCYAGQAYLAGKRAAEKEMNTEYPDGKIVSGVTFIGNPFIYPAPSKKK